MTTPDPALLRAYRATQYYVDDAPHSFVLRVEARSPELLALYARSGVSQAAYLTACNPRSRVLPAAENAARMAELASALAAAGYALRHGRGADPSGQWAAEESVLVLGMIEAEARAWGRRFGQNAVLWAGEDGVVRLVWCARGHAL